MHCQCLADVPWALQEREPELEHAGGGSAPARLQHKAEMTAKQHFTSL